MDIRDARIDSLLQEIINTNLCEVPRDEPWTVEQFEKRTAVCIFFWLSILNIASLTYKQRRSNVTCIVSVVLTVFVHVILLHTIQVLIPVHHILFSTKVSYFRSNKRGNMSRFIVLQSRFREFTMKTLHGLGFSSERKIIYTFF